MLADPEAVAHAAASEVARTLADRVRHRGQASLALAGGATPRRLYELLATVEVPWERVHLFWGDERCVPAGDPRSNFGMANSALIERVAIPRANVHRVSTELSPPEAAAAYERLLREHFPGEDPPRLDLALLGVGRDGHVASLFPGHPALDERQRWVLGVRVLAWPPDRITLTLPVLDAAERVLFVATGAEKRAVLREILQAPDAVGHPAALVRAPSLWLVDRAAVGDPIHGRCT